MWVLMNDCFISIVSKAPAKDGELLVRARRPGDIEKVFGRRTKVMRATDSDYLFRAVVAKESVTRAIQNEVMRIDYDNFKSSVIDDDLHDAYLKVWTALAFLQNPRPYSEVFKHMPSRPLTNEAISNVLPKKPVNVIVPCTKVVDAVSGEDITRQPHVRYVGKAKKGKKK